MKLTQIKSSLVKRLQSLKHEAETLSPTIESVEWYLINQVDLLSDAVEISESKGDIDRCLGVFSRFCTDSLEWDSHLYKKCAEITLFGFRSLRELNG